MRWVLGRLPYPHRLGEGAEPWVKAKAVMPAVEASDAEIVVLHDADVWCPGLPEAVRAVQEGTPWAMPHRSVHRLSESASTAFREGAAWDSLPHEENGYRGVEGGGCLVARREDLFDVPLDPRYVGWGNEDESHGRALMELVGHPVRIKDHLIHLWHPSAKRLDRKWGSTESRALFNRYLRATPDEMRVLVEEAKRDLHSHQPPMHDQAPLSVGKR